jgi:hypothetical protein
VAARKSQKARPVNLNQIFVSILVLARSVWPTKTIPHAIASTMPSDEKELASDARRSANHGKYRVAFRFTGTLNELTLKPEPERQTTGITTS